MKVIVPLAQGFEEIEAITIVDVLRRADIDVTTLFLDKNPVVGSHNITVFADNNINEIDHEHIESIILPGGMPGSKNLKESNTIISLIKQVSLKNGLIGAICAAPMVLGHAGILQGRDATCYPGFEHEMKGANPVDKPVVIDSNIITSKGPGSAIPFALEIVERLKGSEMKSELKKKMQVYWI